MPRSDPEADRLGDAWFDVLTESHREALAAAFTILCDDFFDAYDPGAPGFDFMEDTRLGSYLPPRHRLRYDASFARRFFLTFSTVGWKLAQPVEDSLMLSCVAEELALDALIREAEEWLKSVRRIDTDFSDFRDSAFQDADFEYLFDDRWDGVDEDAEAADLGLTQLRFDRWFEPFLNSQTTIHPYGREPEA